MENVKKDNILELESKREEWLNSGKESKLLTDYSLNSFGRSEKKGRLVLILDKCEDITDEVKSLRFRSENNEGLPTFCPGQYITLTIKVSERFFSKPFTITSTPSDANDGYYEIIVCKSDDQVSKYLLNTVKVNSIIISSAPSGDFYYDRIRDTRDVIAIGSEEEIIPIYAMARSLTDGSYHYNMTIFYHAKREKDLFLKNELDKLLDETSRLKVIYVLSDEEKNGYQKGYVSLNKIKKEMNDNNTFFISCQDGMLKYFEKELEPLNLPIKYIHYYKGKLTCNIRPVQTFNMVIYINGEKYETKCYNNKTILQSILEMGIYIPSKCQNGTCGLCQSELVMGKVKIMDDLRSASEKKYNFIHPCVTYPLSDIEIIIR